MRDAMWIKTFLDVLGLSKENNQSEIKEQEIRARRAISNALENEASAQIDRAVEERDKELAREAEARMRLASRVRSGEASLFRALGVRDENSR